MSTGSDKFEFVANQHAGKIQRKAVSFLPFTAFLPSLSFQPQACGPQ
jgi:hypothetical protein